MRKFLMYPFKLSFQEIKKNYQIKKELSESDSKKNIIPSFIYMNYMFLIIYSVVYVALVYLLAVGIFYSPLAFLPLVTTSIFLWVAILLHKNVYPKTRESYLKSTGFYKNN